MAGSPMPSDGTAIALKANAIRMKRMQKKAAKADNPLFLPSPNLMASALTHFSGSSRSKSKGSHGSHRTSANSTTQPRKADALQALLASSGLQKSFSAAPSQLRSEMRGSTAVTSSGNQGHLHARPPFGQPTGVAAALVALQQAGMSQAPKPFPNLMAPSPFNRGGFSSDPLASLLTQMQTQNTARADHTSQLVAALLQANKAAPAGGDMLDTVAQLLLQRYAAQKQQQQQTLLQQLLNPTFPNPQTPAWQPEFQIPEHDASLSGPSDSSESDGGCLPRGSSSDDSGDECQLDIPPNQRMESSVGVSTNEDVGAFESCSINTDGWGSELWPEDDLSALDQFLGPVGKGGLGALPDGNLDPMTWNEAQPDDGSPVNWVPTTPPTTKAAHIRNQMADTSSFASPQSSGAQSFPSACSSSRPEMSSTMAPSACPPAQETNASVESLLQALVAGTPGLANSINPTLYSGAPNLLAPTPPPSFAHGSFMEAVTSAATLPPPKSHTPSLPGMEALVGLVESFVQQQNGATGAGTGPLLSELLSELEDEKPPARQSPGKPDPKLSPKPSVNAAIRTMSDARQKPLVSSKPAPSNPTPQHKPAMSGAPSGPPSAGNRAAEARGEDHQVLKRGPFSEEEDRRFLGKLAEYGRKITFKKMTQFFPGRSERQLRRRWVRLKRKHNIVTISGVQDVLDKLPPIPVEPGPITLEQLVDCFKLPMQDACQKLSVGRPQVLTTQRFRQLFQKHGIARWPYRQVMAGRPVPEILKAAEEERARRKHLESECSTARKTVTPLPNPWDSPPPTAALDEDDEEDWGALSDDDTSDDDDTDDDSELLDAELDGPEGDDRCCTPPLPERTHSFGGFPSLPQGSPLSRCSSAAMNRSRSAGIAVPSFPSFGNAPRSPVQPATPVPPRASLLSQGGAKNLAEEKGGSGNPPISDQEVFSEMAAAMFLNENGDGNGNGDPDWQCFHMLVDDLDGPDSGKAEVGHKRSASEASADVELTSSSEEGAHKRTKSC